MLRHRAATSAATLLLCTLTLAATAAAASAIDAREVAGGLDAPVAFTFGPGKQIWYVEKTTGEVRVDRPRPGRRLACSSTVVGRERRRRARDARHRAPPAVPGQAVRLRLRHPHRPTGACATRSCGSADRRGLGDQPEGDLQQPGELQPVSQRGAHRVRSRPQALRDRRRGARSVERTGPVQQRPRQDPADRCRTATCPRRTRSTTGSGRSGSATPSGSRSTRSTGNLWESENGPGCNDEVNLIRRGRNYGWGPNQTCDGSSPGNTNQDGPDPVLPETSFYDPIGITGIAFCDGCGLGDRSRGRGVLRRREQRPRHRMILDGGAERSCAARSSTTIRAGRSRSRSDPPGRSTSATSTASSSSCAAEEPAWRDRMHGR